MRFIILILILCSCTKKWEDVSIPQPVHKYQLWIDHIAKDYSVMGRRTLFWQAYLPKEKNGGADTIPEQIFLNCATDSIEHQYYIVDDALPKTIFKLKPSLIDTNWINYSAK